MQTSGSPAPSAAARQLVEQFSAELELLALEDSELVADLCRHVLAAIARETSGPDSGALTLGVDQAGAIALSVLTGAVAIAEEQVDGGAAERRAHALRRTDELAGLIAQLAEREPRYVESMSTRRLVGAVARRRTHRPRTGRAVLRE